MLRILNAATQTVSNAAQVETEFTLKVIIDMSTTERTSRNKFEVLEKKLNVQRNELRMRIGNHRLDVVTEREPDDEAAQAYDNVSQEMTLATLDASVELCGKLKVPSFESRVAGMELAPLAAPRFRNRGWKRSLGRDFAFSVRSVRLILRGSESRPRAWIVAQPLAKVLEQRDFVSRRIQYGLQANTWIAVYRNGLRRATRCAGVRCVFLMGLGFRILRSGTEQADWLIDEPSGRYQI